VGDVLAFTRLANPVALDRSRQNHCRLARCFNGGLVGCVNLDGIVSAERQLLQLLVGQMLDHVEQLRVGTPEMLSNVLAGFDRVLLILAVDDLAHAFDQQAVVILLEQRVPLAAPDDLDDVPACAAEGGLELLDDLAVAANGTIEALQIAIDDEDQVVELLA
jgi:hypothetical protein